MHGLQTRFAHASTHAHLTICPYTDDVVPLLLPLPLLQEAGIPLRDEEGRWCSASGRCGPAGQKVGPMKWGVGKLIANSYPKTPIVLPFFHM